MSKFNLGDIVYEELDGVLLWKFFTCTTPFAEPDMCQVPLMFMCYSKDQSECTVMQQGGERCNYPAEKLVTREEWHKEAQRIAADVHKQITESLAWLSKYGPPKFFDSHTRRNVVIAVQNIMRKKDCPMRLWDPITDAIFGIDREVKKDD